MKSALRQLQSRIARIEARRDPERERLAWIDGILGEIDRALEADAARERHMLDHGDLAIVRNGIASWKNLRH
ncbi:MAG: hypothetical protein IPK48_01450 [Gammaproteobacteria bacterium]|nr:hypothetical protein [Gammaproteobacteria bacterium]